MITIYGIKNCDTMKKAMKWLDAQGVEYTFHDFKKAGLDEGLMKTWLQQVQWDELINRRGTSWRKLPEELREHMDQASAIQAAVENPSLIKRPVLELKDQLVIGFKAEHYQEIFS